MTWYADEILLRATDEAIERVRADTALAPFAYHVPALSDFEWHSPSHCHELPEGGLLVIRPVGRPAAHQRWYGEEVLDWSRLKPGLRAEHSSLDTDVETRLSKLLEEEAVPPFAFRAYLGALAHELRAPLMYYSCSMWGGEVDIEYCLVYDADASETSLVTKTADSQSRDRSVDTLQEVLRSVGLSIPSPFFLLHTRTFPWQPYRLLK